MGCHSKRICLIFLLVVLGIPCPSPAAAAISPHARLWTDPAGDLWVSTPMYLWNITGGRRIDFTGGRRAVQSNSSRRVIEAFFLDPGAGGDLKYTIVSQHDEAATIYFQRDLSGSSEGLELTILFNGESITVVHRQMENTSTPAPATLSNPLTLLGASRPQKAAGEIPVRPGALRKTPVAYSLSYDRDGGAAMAWVQPVEPLSPVASAGLDSCTPLYGSQECAQNDLPGIVVGREYLLFFQGGKAGPLKTLETWAAGLQQALPDLDAAYITRSPRYDFDAVKNSPAVGDSVVFSAHVYNGGGAATGQFSYIWKIDGLTASIGTHPSLAAGASTELELKWAWQAGAHTVSFELDPSHTLVEISEENNRLEDRTGAIAIGFWVEQSVYDHFNLHQVDLGLGSNSWYDYAQRQVRVWNDIFADSLNPLTPEGVLERVRLDEVTVVPDGALPNPFPSNDPNLDDKTIDLEWGFPSESVGVPSTHPDYGPYYLDYPEAQNVDYSLMHELSHARYLDDLYTLNVTADPVALTDSIGSSDTTLTVESTVGNGGFTAPAYLAVEGELIICSIAEGHTFSDCTRGAEGTTPRAHPAGTVIHRASVRAQDGQGNLVMGSPAMPLIYFNDHLYINRYMEDMMSAGQAYLQHSATALNLIAGRRAVCGNANAPCNLGVYQNDSPEHNILIIAQGKDPVPGATVEVFRARPFDCVYNGEVYLRDPDLTLQTDADGQIDLGHFPFNPTTPTSNSFNRLLLLRVTYAGNVFYRFLEITRFNEAYWSGDRDSAYYYLDPTTEMIDLWVRPRSAEGHPGDHVVVPLTWGNNGATLADAPVLEATFDPALQVSGTYPAAASTQPGQVTWALPYTGSLQPGKVELTLRLPLSATQSTYRVQWQINQGGEAFPSDNQGSSSIGVEAVEYLHMYLPFIWK